MLKSSHAPRVRLLCHPASLSLWAVGVRRALPVSGASVV
jgi:hypothetical protein